MPLAVGWTWRSKYKHRFSSNLTCSWNLDKTSICPLGQSHCSSRMTAGLLLVSLLLTPHCYFLLSCLVCLSKGHNGGLMNSLCRGFLCWWWKSWQEKLISHSWFELSFTFRAAQSCHYMILPLAFVCNALWPHHTPECVYTPHTWLCVAFLHSLETSLGWWQVLPLCCAGAECREQAGQALWHVLQLWEAVARYPDPGGWDQRPGGISLIASVRLLQLFELLRAQQRTICCFIHWF